MCYCGRSANWKREEVPDHKFDFIDVRDYRSNSVLTRLRYMIMWALVVKSFAVYIADVYTAITLIALKHFSNTTIYDKVCTAVGQDNIYVPIEYARWIFLGCIIFSFTLLLYEAHKSRAIVRSRDISYAFTNVMANNWYSMRSYDHFCFFCQINNSKKKKDEFAFFIFFTFKGWKRLLVADGPRQTINALVLFNFARCNNFSTEFKTYTNNSWTQAVLVLTMLFTVAVFVASLLLLVVACLMYLPLLAYIKGNLKEYCCHKIDKRISELIQHRKKQRLAKLAAIQRKEAAGDFSHLKNRKGEMVGAAMQQPTLPTLDIDVLKDDGQFVKGSAGASAGKRSRPGSIGSSVGGMALAPETDPGKLGYFADSPGYGPVTFHGPSQAALAAGLDFPPAPPRTGSSMGSFPPAYGVDDAVAYPPGPGSLAGGSPKAHALHFTGGAGAGGYGSQQQLWSGTDLPPPVMPAAAAEPGRAASPGPHGSPMLYPTRVGSPFGGHEMQSYGHAHAQSYGSASASVSGSGAGFGSGPPGYPSPTASQQPDLSAYMPYSDDQYLPQPGYVQQPYSLPHPHAHASADADADEGSSSFFAQLNDHQRGSAAATAAAAAPVVVDAPAASHVPTVHVETLHDVAAQGSRPASYGAGAALDVSRHASVNFEDIYSQYEDPDPHAHAQAQAHTLSHMPPPHGRS